MSAGMHYSLSLATGAFVGPLRGAMSALGGLTGTLSNLGNITTGISSIKGALETIIAPLAKPVTLAGDMEALETSFRALLKSGPAAKSMVQDLMQFADATPFNPEPVAEAGKQLLAFGFAAKSIKPLLTDIGDLAAVMNKPIEEVADAFGRLQSGQFGEAFEAMKRFGIARKDLEGAGLKFDKAGSFLGSTDQALEAVRSVIRSKFGGGMEELSKTFGGKVSTMEGYWNQLQRTVGGPLAESLKPAIEQATKELQKLVPEGERIGKDLGESLSGALHAFTAGGGTLGQRLGESFKSLGATLSAILMDSFEEPIADLQARIAAPAKWWQMLLDEDNNLVKEDAAQSKIRGQMKDAERQLAVVEAKAPGSGATSWLGEMMGTPGDNEMSPERYEAEKGRILRHIADLNQQLQASIQRAAEFDPRSFPNVEEEKKRILEEGPRVATPWGEKSAQDFRDYATRFAPPPYTKTDFASLTDMVTAARGSMLAPDPARWVKTRNDESGNTNELQASLNPERIMQLMNPGQKEDPDRLAEAIARRITGSSLLETMARHLETIAMPDTEGVAAQF